MNKKTNIDNAKLVFEELEPRLLLSADGLGVITETSVTTLQTLVHSENENIIIVQHQTEQSSTVVYNKTQTDSRSELVIIDSRAPNFQQLHNDVIKAQQQGRDINVVILDAHRDGIEQISDALDKYNKLDAVHIVSHGKDAQLQLGATQLNSQNLKQRSDEINKWQQVFSDGGDLLIYGCNLAGTENGTDLVNSLSTLTGADIAASDDVTGNNILGGDWDLEYQTGNIETSIAFTDDIQDNWQGTLNADALAASEQQALVEEEQAQEEQEAALLAESEAVLLAEEQEAESVAQEAEQQAGIVEEQRQEIVFIDESVTDYQSFIDDLQSNSDKSTAFEIIVLNRETDGIEQVSNVLSAYNDVDAIHIISHGDDGTVKLGNTWLNDENIGDYSDSLTIWTDALDENADILIYGCNLAESEAGEQFVNQLALLTSADVAASDDLTGNAALGGDWQLEYNAGTIETGIALSETAQAEYEAVLATIIVDNTSDSGIGSLRQAIIDANATVGVTDTITFNIAGAGPHIISLTSALPTITDTVIIDASSEPDYAGDPVVRIDGDLLGVGVNGLTFSSGADGSSVQGLMITKFSGDGIQIDLGADGISITGNWIGTTGTGSTGTGNNTGINVQGANTIIGGTGVNDGNVITNNGNEGINLTGTGATGTIIQGNIIGLDPDGVTGSGNSDVGIALLSGSHNTTIGGTTVEARNIISNNFEGIEINSNNNTVQGNYIGTDITGTLDRGNHSSEGIQIKNSGTGNLIGGAAAGAGNIIAYSGSDGIQVENGTGNTILGNSIYSSTGQAIDIGVNGIQANDSGDGDTGANNLQNFPVLSTAVTNGVDSITIDGSFNSTASSYYRIEFFASTTGDASGYGEAETYLGYADIATDGSGNATINITLTAAVADGAFISATATKSDATYTTFTDTSEFAANIVASAAPVATNVPAAQTTDEDTALVFNAANGNLISISDADVGGDDLDVTLTVADGTLTLSQTTGLSFVTGDGTADASMNFTGTLSDINSALDGLSFTPDADFNGSVNLQIITYDEAGLLGVYSFDNAANLGADNSPGTTSDGTVSGATQVTNPDRGEVLNFVDAVPNDMVTINGLYGSPSNVTLSAWVDFTKPVPTPTGTGIVISLGDAVAIRVGGYSTDAVTGFFYDGTTWHEIEFNASISGSGWHHVAYTFDDITNTQKLYLDGVEVASGSNTSSISYTSPAIAGGTLTNTTIGSHSDPDEDQFAFVGNIDDAQIYDRALTAAEIADAMNAPPGMDSDTVAITVNPVNDAPTYSSTALAPTWNENGGAVSLFSGTSIDAIDAGDLINVLTIDVTGLADGSDEILVIDGQAIALTDLNSVTTAGNSYNVNVSAPGANATVTISRVGGFSAAAAEALVDGLAYDNASEAPQGVARIVTLGLIQDDGGTANGGQNTTTYNLDSVVTIVAVNDAPVANADSSHLVFDGEDFIQVADHTSLQMTNNLTMEAWINHSGNGTGSQIILNKEGEYELGITSDTGEIKFAIANAPTWNWYDTGFFVTANEWTHIAVTYDAVAGEAKTFINGNLVDTYSQSGAVGDVYPGLDDLFIGGRENAATQRFQGSIDDVRIWESTRTEVEIQNNYSDNLSGAEPGLAGNWRLNEADGTLVADQSPNGNNGTLGGVEGAASTPTYDGYFTNEDTLLVIPAVDGVLANDFDADGDTLTVTNLDTTGMLGTLVLNPADGSFSYDPRGVFDSLDVGEIAYETFTYTANDGALDSNVVSVTITVIGANDAPTVDNPIPDQIATEDTAFSYQFAVNAFGDVDGDTLTFTSDAAGWLSFDALTRTVSGTPLNGDVGTTTVTVTADDGNLGTVSDTFDIVIGNCNDAPVITSAATFNVAENTTAVTTVTATDVDTDTPTFTISGGSDAGLFSVDLNSGVLSFNTAPDFENPGDNNTDNIYIVEVTADDGNGGTDVQTISVRVADAAEGIRITPTTIVPLGDETLVNTETADNQLIGANISQAIATDANGNYVVVWASNLQDSSGWGVYAQLFNADGSPQGVEISVNTTFTGGQLSPSVAMDGTGNFVVAWQSENQDGSSYGVYTRPFDAAGNPLGPETLVNTETANYQGSPGIAMAPNGDYIVIWTSSGQDNPDGNSGIYAQLFNADGSTKGGEFRVNTYTVGHQQVSSVSMDDAGNFVVTWGSENQDGSNYGVFGQLFDANGVAYGSEFQVNTTTANSQLYNDVVMLPDGRFIVAYQSVNADTSVDLLIQRFEADGTPIGGEIQVNAVSDMNYFPIPSITADASGNFTVVWNNSNDGAGNGVFVRSYDWAGTALTGELQVNTTTTGDQVYPDVVAQPGGGFIVVWGGYGAGDADGVFTQRYGLSTIEGETSTSFEIVLESAPTSDVTIPISVSDGTEGSLSISSITFTSANWNIAQTVTVSGIQDYALDGTQVFTVNIGPAISADPKFNGLNPADLTITNFEAANTPPQITSDGAGPTASININENVNAVTTVSAGDLDGDTPTFSISGGADQGLFTIDTNTGVLTFNVAADFENPTDSNTDNVYVVEVTASDGNGGTDLQTILVTVTDVNETPTLVTLSNSSVDENTDTSAGHSVGSLTTTDEDAGDSTGYSIVGGADQLLFSIGGPGSDELILSDGVLDFESQASYEVTVRITDSGGLTHDQTFTINVNNLNEAPTFDSTAVIVATEDTAYSYTITSSDVDGDALTIIASTLPAWLTLTDNSNGTATLTGTPLNAEVGDHSVVLQVSDGSLIDTQSFTISVGNTNDAPTVANAIIDKTATEDTAFSFQFAINTFNDVDGDTLTYTSDAVGWLSFDAATRTFSGTPLNADVGTTTVTVTADDGNGGTISDTFDIVVSNTNDAPTVANLVPDQVATEDSVFTFIFAANTFNDIDGDTLTYTSDASGWLSFDAVTRTFSGTPLNADVGTTTVTVTADDGNGGTVSDTFDIVISNTNDAPTVANLVPDQEVTEDAAFTFTFASNTFNDVDVGDTLSYTSDASGWLSFDAATRTFSGTPLNGDVGTTTVTLTADDGNGGTISDTFDIVISNANDAPTVANMVPDQVATEDAVFSFQFASNTFNDVDGDTLTYTSDASGWLSFDAATRTFSGTPLNADVGTTTVTVTADDGNGGTISDTFDIVISNTNDAPTVANLVPDQVATEDAAFSFQFASNTFNDIDVGDTLTYTSDASGWLSFDAATRTFSGTPLNADVGTTTVTVTADDGNGGTISDTFNIVISNTNDAPTVANLVPDQVATEDTAFTFTFAVNTFNDVDGDVLTYTSDASGWLSFDAATRTFSGTPLNADVGTTTVTVTADDGNSGTISDTFDIVISNTNDAPVAVNDNPNAVDEGGTAIFDLAANDFDSDNALNLNSITIITAPANGSLIVNGDGTVSYTHDGSETTSDSFTYTIADISGAISNTASVTITVNPVNDAPSAVDDALAVDEGNTINIDLIANDVDVDNALDLNSIVIVGAPAYGSLTVNGNGTVDYTHNGSETISDSFTYTITDISGAISNVATVNIVVNSVNDTPTTVGITDVTVLEDPVTSSTINLNAAFDDTDNVDADLTYTITGNSSIGLFDSTAVNAVTGELVLDYAANMNGSSQISIRASDPSGASVDTLFTVTVTPVNDTPVIMANTGLVATGTGSTTISNAQLNVNDVDNTNAEIIYTITELPANGELIINGVVATIGSGFSENDLINNNVSYQSGGTGTNDQFGFTVADGAGGSITGNSFNIVVQLAAVPPEEPLEPEVITEPEEPEETVTPKVLITPVTRLAPAVDEGFKPIGGSSTPQQQQPVLTIEPVVEQEAVENIEEVVESYEAEEETEVSKVDFTTARSVADIQVKSIAALWTAIDEMKQEMSENVTENISEIEFRAAAISSSGVVLTAGVVAWVLRSGALMASLISTIPLWKGYDPLPLLVYKNDEEKEIITEDKIPTSLEELKKVKALKEKMQKQMKVDRLFGHAGMGE